jgi:hypothetical protein
MDNTDTTVLIGEIEKIKLEIKILKRYGQLQKLELNFNVFNFYTNKWMYGSMRMSTLQKHKENLSKILNALKNLE